MESRTLHTVTRHRRRLPPTQLRLALVMVLLLLAPPSLRGEAPLLEAPITAEDRDHWSFQPLSRPALPLPSPSFHEQNPIDRFILAELEAQQLPPQRPADRVTLIRRLHFGLLGLPPSRAAVDAFVGDASPVAYERLVDQLLASHHYGEHWAQHWLDLARFAETDGFEHDKVRGEAWKYRDWVIDALNADMPYDEFVLHQLAADEIAPQTEQPPIATMFCLSGPDMPDINSQEERRHNVLNELTSTVGSVLLGLQVGCAQCHDHKYDPISQADFYRLRAIFEPALQVKKNESLSVLRARDGVVQVSHLMLRGDWQHPGPAVQPAVPRIACLPGDTFEFSPAVAASGRRTEFASWLTTAGNPLTARVIANRVWQHHFGRGLSRTPSDFGIVGDEPTHPELLDWLATELIEHDWSIKHLHRFILTSATYRQASRPHNNDRDPSNLWLSRFPRQRLSGEVIRDAMFAASDTLNYAAHGPGVMPPLPEELLKTLLKNQWNTSERVADHYRRSIYLFARRNLRYPIFDAFDRPDGNASCPRRGRSTTAPQSLLLLNSAFSLDAAQRLAGTVLGTHHTVDDHSITLVFQRVLSRPPDDEEMKLLVEFVAQQASQLRREANPHKQLALPLPCPATLDPYAAAALTDLCLALFNSNEFIYID